MCQNATRQELYRQRAVVWDQYAIDEPQDMVHVQLVKWVGGGETDSVLTSTVVVGGEKQFTTSKVVHGDEYKLIREAIALFDELMEAHPARGDFQQ